jgi:hypothetical protein
MTRKTGVKLKTPYQAVLDIIKEAEDAPRINRKICLLVTAAALLGRYEVEGNLSGRYAVYAVGRKLTEAQRVKLWARLGKIYGDDSYLR